MNIGASARVGAVTTNTIHLDIGDPARRALARFLYAASAALLMLGVSALAG
jgi:hypothetical protein